MRVADTTFVVVDVETTGGRAAHDRLIELGAVKLRGGQVIDCFEQLVNPGCAVPRHITRLTGISTAMLLDGPPVERVLSDFEAFLGDGVFVAHNLKFDAGVLTGESERCGRPGFPGHKLCTLRLARRLLRGLRSKSLASLCDFYGIRNRRHHRALPDAEVTAQILIRLLDHLDLEFGIDDLPGVLSFQHKPYRALHADKPHLNRIRDEVLDSLPDGPGVYFMKDGRGKVLYVGKAQRLVARVRSYFTAVEGHEPHVRRLVDSVRQITWEETPSELDALVLESRKIKELQPPYNRAARRYQNRPFLRIETGREFPVLSWSAFLHDDGAEYYGPLSSRNEAEFLVDLINRFFRLRECDDDLFRLGRGCVYGSIGRCLAPCLHEDASDYLKELDLVRTFLSGVDIRIAEQIEAAMRRASKELDFEQAATYRDWLRRLEHIMAKRGAIATRVLDHNAVILHRGDGRSPTLSLVVKGRHVATVVIDNATESHLDELEVVLERHLDSGSIPQVYREREIDEMYLLAHWLYVRRSEVKQIPWNPDMPPAEIRRLVAEALEREFSAADLVAEPDIGT